MASDSRNSSVLLWGITTALVAAVVIFFAYQWLFATSNEKLPEYQDINAQSVSPAKKSAVPASVEQPPVATEEETIKLVEEDLLKAPVPENASLAKEEIARMDDLQAQLKDQEKILKQQHADADELIKLKEEQLKLLEAQLAQN